MQNRWYVPLLCSLFLFIGCHPHENLQERNKIDALNERAYRFRYVCVDSTAYYAQKALSLAAHYVEGQAEARLNLAFVRYQQMDFEGVDSILQRVYDNCQSPLLLLCADVMHMKADQRTGNGARFFQIKNQAEERMKSVARRESSLSPHETTLWVYAQTEFHLITSTYYCYQEQDSLARTELAAVPHCLRLHVDTAQWVYYNYMFGPGGLVEGHDANDILLQEFDYLFRAYSISRRNTLPYFEANCLQAFATMFLTGDSLLSCERSDAYNLLRFQHAEALSEDDNLPLALAQRALSLFQSYDDLFQTACAYRTIGEVDFRQGRYEQSLENYAKALHCVNIHHLRYYGKLSADTLSVFNPLEPDRIIVNEWIDDPRISTVPEWIAGIRQQLSLTFSAMGMKQASDYNRNSYIDLLQATNQNLELESRTAVLERQTRALRGRMYLSIFLLAVALLLAFLFRRRMQRRSTIMLRELEGGKWQPYNDFVAWNTGELQKMEEENEEQHERLHMARMRMEENKRKNIENRAKVSLVHAIVPFLDRIGGEVIRMKQQSVITPERREYIKELVDEIDRCNDVLTEWIKMEQGQLSLHITTFPLDKLFRIVADGHYSFDQKKIRLRVDETTAMVKADESLTLFMINTLADNARKFTPEGGEVWLSAEETEEYVEVRVSDTGYGLSETEVDMLMHSKVYDTSQIGKGRGEKGFGFGLMNCRGIIEKYKKASSLFNCSAFGVRSRIGEGSTFYFRLPRVVRLLLFFLSLSCMTRAESTEAVLYDSVYWANVEGRYEDAIHYATQFMDVLNEAHPRMPGMVVIDTIEPNRDAAELLWARQDIKADYPLIIGLRNELALAALALNDWPMYHYNNRACIRLHKLVHQDKSLPTYFSRLERTHRNNNIFLGVILLGAVVILFFSYKLLVLTQLRKRHEIGELKQYIQKLFSIAYTKPQLAAFLTATSNYPDMSQWAKDYQGKVAALSVRPMNEKQDEANTLTDELARLDYEQNRLYVQNQVLDNCLSTIKHESMYYPSRIRQLVDKMENSDIGQLAELVQYYHHIYMLLCQQADAQVSQPGFKRQQVDAHEALRRVADVSARLQRRMRLSVKVDLVDQMRQSPMMIADETLLRMLFESLLTGMLHEGAMLSVRASEEDGFVRFTIRDHARDLSDEEINSLFFPEAGRISYLVAKQIIREHDIYTNHPGCRLVARRAEDGGYEVFFTLPVVLT